MNFSCLLTSLLICPLLAAAPLRYQGEAGPGEGKHIVFIANDHEYRSEETCPALARILAKHHGFTCTVLFGEDESGHIKAGSDNLPYLEELKDADLLVFFTRFMNLPDEDVQHLVDYYESGKPTIGIRTSTHAFNKQEGKWSKLNFDYEGEDYLGGLGEQIYGNTWHESRGQDHYGPNHAQGCYIFPAKDQSTHPIWRGVRNMHAFTGAYRSRLPVGATSVADLKVLNTFHPSVDFDQDKDVVTAAWTRPFYYAPSGKKKEARMLYSSFGGSEDLLDENVRRFLINSSFWALGMEEAIQSDLNVSFIGSFDPSPNMTGAFYREGVKPLDLVDYTTGVMPEEAAFGGLENPTNQIKYFADQVLSARPLLVERLEKTVEGFDRDDYTTK